MIQGLRQVSCCVHGGNVIRAVQTELWPPSLNKRFQKARFHERHLATGFLKTL